MVDRSGDTSSRPLHLAFSKDESTFINANLFYNNRRSERSSVRNSFINLGMLELSYRFQTLHDYSCSS